MDVSFAPPTRNIGTQRAIVGFIHCAKCTQERPPGTSPEEFARLSVGLTRVGLQVWCVRHACNVTNIDFEGAKHPANNWCTE